MGTNFYLHQDKCPHCGRSDEPLHIGKSSAGWAFALHIDPDKGINGLADWQRLWSMPGSKIVNEHGDTFAPEEMMSRITDRSHPHGLSRCEIDGYHCVGHGEGTWDLHVGEFS